MGIVIYTCVFTDTSGVRGSVFGSGYKNTPSNAMKHILPSGQVGISVQSAQPSPCIPDLCSVCLREGQASSAPPLVLTVQPPERCWTASLVSAAPFLSGCSLFTPASPACQALQCLLLSSVSCSQFVFLWHCKHQWRYCECCAAPQPEQDVPLRSSAAFGTAWERAGWCCTCTEAPRGESLDVTELGVPKELGHSGHRKHFYPIKKQTRNSDFMLWFSRSECQTH